MDRSDRTTRKKLAVIAAAGAALILILAVVFIGLLREDHETADPTAVRPTADAATPDAAPAEAPPDAAAAAAPVPDAARRPRRGWRRITDRELRRLQRQNSGLLRACYARLSRHAPALARGRANVTMQLGERGRIRSVQVTAGDRALEGCLRRAVLRWRFSPTLRPQRISFPVVVAGR